MASIKLTLPGCWPAQVPFGPKVLAPPSCLGVDDISSAEVKTGSRTLLVTPYDPDKLGTNVICSGQYGQWQVLVGLGGQIHRGMYMGSSVKKDDTVVDAPGIEAKVDKGDCINPGEKALAIRDRGRWYVTKMGSVQARSIVVIVGGNTLAAGVPGIKYAPGPLTATKVYDPDVDVEYPEGMGTALSYINGKLQPKKVLVRHNYAAAKGAIVGGIPLRVFGSESLIFEPSGGTPVTMKLLTFEWPGEG